MSKICVVLHVLMQRDYTLNETICNDCKMHTLIEHSLSGVSAICINEELVLAKEAIQSQGDLIVPTSCDTFAYCQVKGSGLVQNTLVLIVFWTHPKCGPVMSHVAIPATTGIIEPSVSM